MTTYYATVVDGLEMVSWSEIHEVLPAAQLLRTTRGKLTIEYNGQPEDFFALRSIENIYIAVAAIPHIGYRRDSLHKLQAAMETLPLEPALADLQRVRQTHPELSMGRKHAGKKGFRVTSTMTGERAYRRIDAQVAVEKGLLQRFPGQWELDLKDPDIDIWLDLAPEEALIGLRLSNGLLRRREYKQAHIPASLKPTVAYAMVRLSEPAPDDVFLDPMCGAGTILIERALSGRYKILLGGDIDPRAVAATHENLGPRHQPWEVVEWDARHLPLADGSVDKVVSNLPFGKQIGTLAENEHLYRDVLNEIERVTRPGGRIILLTSRWQLIADLISRNTAFLAVSPNPAHPKKNREPGQRNDRKTSVSFDEIPSISIDLLGERAYIFTFVRQSSERRQEAPRPSRREPYYSYSPYNSYSSNSYSNEERFIPMQEENEGIPEEQQPAASETAATSGTEKSEKPPSRASRLLRRALSRQGLLTGNSPTEVEQATQAPAPLPAQEPARSTRQPGERQPRPRGEERPPRYERYEQRANYTPAERRARNESPGSREPYRSDRNNDRTGADRPGYRSDRSERYERNERNDRMDRSERRPPRNEEERPYRRFEDNRPPRRFEDDRRGPYNANRPGNAENRPYGRYSNERSERPPYENENNRTRRVVDRTAEDRRARQEEQDRSSRTPRGSGEYGGRSERRYGEERSQPRRYGSPRSGNERSSSPRSGGYDNNRRPTRPGGSSEYSSQRFESSRPPRRGEDDRFPRRDRPGDRYGDTRNEGGSDRPQNRFSSDSPRGPRSGGPPRRRP